MYHESPGQFVGPTMTTGSTHGIDPRMPRFLTVRETAMLLAVSEMTVYRMISDRQLPAVRLRSRCVVPAAAIGLLTDGVSPALPEPLGSVYLGVSVVAHILRVSKATIYRLIQDGGLRALRLRGRVVVPGDVIDTMTSAAWSTVTAISPPEGWGYAVDGFVGFRIP